MNLTDREKEIVRQMRDARIAAIKRRRSWRLSERTMAAVEVNRLTDKLIGVEREDGKEDNNE